MLSTNKMDINNPKKPPTTPIQELENPGVFVDLETLNPGFKRYLKYRSQPIEEAIGTKTFIPQELLPAANNVNKKPSIQQDIIHRIYCLAPFPELCPTREGPKREPYLFHYLMTEEEFGILYHFNPALVKKVTEIKNGTSIFQYIKEYIIDKQKTKILKDITHKLNDKKKSLKVIYNKFSYSQKTCFGEIGLGANEDDFATTMIPRVIDKIYGTPVFPELRQTFEDTDGKQYIIDYQMQTREFRLLNSFNPVFANKMTNSKNGPSIFEKHKQGMINDNKATIIENIKYQVNGDKKSLEEIYYNFSGPQQKYLGEVGLGANEDDFATTMIDRVIDID